MHGVMTIPGNR